MDKPHKILTLDENDLNSCMAERSKRTVNCKLNSSLSPSYRIRGMHNDNKTAMIIEWKKITEFKNRPLETEENG